MTNFQRALVCNQANVDQMWSHLESWHSGTCHHWNAQLAKYLLDASVGEMQLEELGTDIGKMVATLALVSLIELGQRCAVAREVHGNGGGS